jgi:predicted nucleic acid-binding protein
MAIKKLNDRRYWDACNFIGLINREPDKTPECEPILRDAQSSNPRIQLITSIPTIAEVVKPKGCIGLTPAQEQQINDFFENEWIIPVNLDRVTMIEARRLQRLYELKPHDAIHLASALFAEVAVVESYDPDLLRWDGKVPMPYSSNKGLEIRKPRFGYPFQQDLPK